MSTRIRRYWKVPANETPEEKRLRHRTYQRTYLERHPEQKAKLIASKKATAYMYALKRCYGLSLDQYNLLYAKQNGKCVICGRLPNGCNSRMKKLRVDHNHATNHVRGLLCHQCNVGIGHLDESVDVIRRAISYIESNI